MPHSCRSLWCVCTAALVLLAGVVSQAQFDADDRDDPTLKLTPGGVTLGDEETQYWQCRISVSADKGMSKDIIATLPIPANWPEQSVKVVSQKASSYAKVSFEKQPGGNMLMVVKIATLPAGEKAEAEARFAVKTHTLKKPAKTADLKIPTVKQLTPELRTYLKPSVNIEATNKKIKRVAGTIGRKAKTDWDVVQEIYDWVRNELQYENGDAKGAVKALQDKTGDCEEYSALFIALCRAKKIPARTVCVPSHKMGEFHSYAEFCLVDDKGETHWIPCEPLGSKSLEDQVGDPIFGYMPFHHIILQRGDDFKCLEKGKRSRYLPMEVLASGSAAPPTMSIDAGKVNLDFEAAKAGTAGKETAKEGTVEEATDGEETAEGGNAGKGTTKNTTPRTSRRKSNTAADSESTPSTSPWGKPLETEAPTADQAGKATDEAPASSETKPKKVRRIRKSQDWR